MPSDGPAREFRDFAFRPQPAPAQRSRSQGPRFASCTRASRDQFLNPCCCAMRSSAALWSSACARPSRFASRRSWLSCEARRGLVMAGKPRGHLDVDAPTHRAAGDQQKVTPGLIRSRCRIRLRLVGGRGGGPGGVQTSESEVPAEASDAAHTRKGRPGGWHHPPASFK